MSDNTEMAPVPYTDGQQSYVDINANVEIASAEIASAEIVHTMTAEAEKVGEAINESATQALDQSEASFGRAREAAGEVKSGFEAAVAAASSGVSDINMKAFNAMKASADAALDYFSALANAKTLPDVVAVQTEFMRKQLETLNAQSREFAKLTEEVSARSIAPISQTFGRTFGAAA